MSDPGRIYQQVEKFRNELLRHERAAASAMVREYGAVWQRIRVRLDELTKQINDARQAKEDVNISWLFQRNRLASLLAQVEQEIARFVDYADPAIREQQRQAIKAAQRHAEQLVLMQLPEVQTSWSRLPAEAVSDLVGFTEAGPLRELLDKLGPQVSDGFRRALIESITVGRNPRETARRVRKEFSVGLSRALRISRTEQLRSYREATRRNYQTNSDIVEGWVWLAAKQERTCPMCLAMDGTFHKLSERLNDHPNGRCAMIPVVKGMALPQVETGVEWFEKQDEATQRKVLGNPGYEAFNAGEVTLKDFIGQKRSRDWGTTRYARSLTQILGKEDARAWKEIALATIVSKREQSDINFNAIEPQKLGDLVELRHLYPENESGREFLRPLPVVINKWALDHIKQDHPERVKWLSQNREVIEKTVKTPELVYKQLEYKDQMGHWSQMLVRQIEGQKDYLAIVISLARLEGMESETHQIITMYRARRKTFFKADKNGNEAIRPKWISVEKKQKTGI
jgi:SPP1 gp7 family putative phage head morphogenesis protein